MPLKLNNLTNSECNEIIKDSRLSELEWVSVQMSSEIKTFYNFINSSFGIVSLTLLQMKPSPNSTRVSNYLEKCVKNGMFIAINVQKS